MDKYFTQYYIGFQNTQARRHPVKVPESAVLPVQARAKGADAHSHYKCKT